MNILFQRSPRMKQDLPRTVVEIRQPPKKPQRPSFSYSSLIIPLVMTLGTIGLYLYMSSSGNGYSNPNFLVFQMVSTSMMTVSYTIPFFVYLSNKRKYKRALAQRTATYRESLKKHREELQILVDRQAALLKEWNPAPMQCMRRIQTRVSSLWERSPFDADFLSLRLGNGEQPSTITIETPDQEEYDQDPLIKEAKQLAREFSKVSDVPVSLPLNKAHVVGVVGDRASMLNAIRSLVLQLVTHHSPDEVKIVSFYSEDEADQWNWIRWLPHVWDDQRKRRFLATNPRDARELTDHLYEILNRRRQSRRPGLANEPQVPFYVFIISDPSLIEEEVIVPMLLKEGGKVGARTLLLSESKNTLPMECHAILEVHRNHGTLQETNYLQTGEDWEYTFQPDFVSVEVADQTARSLAPVRLKANKSRQIPQMLTLFDLVEAKNLDDLDVTRRWEQNRYPNTLPVSVGMGTGGKRVYLNIHDKIERKGHGPHGLIAGTTGSGKSEVIQALIASLALNYHPHDIVFLLIDYKGGGMSNTFEHLPHLVGSITNLDGNLIERAKISLRAELMRREKLFKDAGNLQHIDEYFQSPMREKNPLPHLVIIIDEFAELKKEQPEFMNELISIAAKGRTLGVHLILATQKPSGVVDDKIWSNSRFRICLRVQEEADSKEMIKIPDASWITTPGRGYFQVGSNELLELVQFAWSGAPYRPKTETVQEAVISEVTLTGRRINRSSPVISTAKKQKGRSKKQLDVLVDYLNREAKALGIETLQGPWLPPLPTHISLDELRPPERKGWDGKTWQPSAAWLDPVVGLVDSPSNQTQYPLNIPLNEGHLPVYGMPGTGKTTFVQTLLLSLALDHSPDDVHMYVLDFGHMFRDFNELPHMGAIIRDDEPDRVRRLFRFLMKEMHRRREKIAQSGAKTFYSYRKSLSEPVPAIIVVIDGYLTFKSTFEEEHADLEQLLRAGGSFGIYFIVTTNQVSDMYDRVRNNFSLGVSFELADPSDYYFAVGRLRSPLVNLPEGRGFVKGSVPPLEFQTALASEGSDEIERANTLRQRIRTLADSWQGNYPKAIESLPKEIELKEVLAKHEADPDQPELTPLRVPVAISMDDLTPFYVNLKDGPYFVVGGSIEGGKTSFLQTWILSLAYFHPPSELEVYVIDFRPSGLGLSALMGLPHLKGYASDETELAGLLEKLGPILDQRAKTKTLPPWAEQTETGEKEPAIFLVIDDADYFSKRLNNYDLQNSLNNIVSQGRNKNFYVAIAGSPSNFPYSSNDWLSEVKGMETGFLFASLDINDLSFFKIPSSEARSSNPAIQKTLGPGEGYFAKRRYEKVKGAVPFSANVSPMDWIRTLQERWMSTKN
ncbi:type VII secretion protein EssC [Thermoactinomyces daqus]|uniref:Type VII secretion protein EssC n=1 Tax=Thermoactinomyces daqus TaxID=1329516 RepID=A0A7W2AI00_9BACL|nr:type VII secretion protein EssC [Thermoactinomyces daqus]MBA4543286.1 type VII secretion protein EssC [Thermoactinomyces daqus]